MGLDMWINLKNKDLDEDKNIIYWRKCNQIYSWFDNHIENMENCGNYEITRETLIDLRNDCQKVLDDHSLAEEILPLASGLFFGCKEYNHIYYNQLINTITDINQVLLDYDNEYDEFYYTLWY